MLAIALLALAGQVSSVVHLLLERHAVCPEHGELIHGDEAGPEALRFDSRHSAGPIVVQESAAALERHGHEHCAVAGNSRGIHADGRAACSHVPPIAATASSSRALPRLPLQAIFMLAPKGSPPV